MKLQSAVAGEKHEIEITRDGERRLSWDATSHTGYNIIEADSLDAAVEVAKRAPFITGVKVFELRSH